MINRSVVPVPGMCVIIVSHMQGPLICQTDQSKPNLLLKMEHLIRDCYLTDILFSGERGTSSSERNLPGGGHDCTGAPVCQLTNTSTLLPSSASMLKPPNKMSAKSLKRLNLFLSVLTTLLSWQRLVWSKYCIR